MGIKPVGPIEVLEKVIVGAEARVRKESWYAAADLTEKANALASRKSLSKAKSIGSFQKRVQALYQQLDAEAQRRLDQARKSYEEKRYTEALSGYRSVVYCFRRRPCAAEARKALAEAVTDPERKRLLDQIKAREMERRIAEMIAKPGTLPGVDAKLQAPKADGTKAGDSTGASRVGKIKALPVAAQAKVVAELEKLAKLYPALPEGQRAAEDHATLRADKSFQANLDLHVKAQKARGLLNLAQAYRGIGKSDRAASYCKRIISQFPGTELATRAKDMLEDIELSAP